jgi:hypothetical protein
VENVIKKNILFFKDKIYQNCSTEITDNTSSSGGWDLHQSILLQTGYLTIDEDIENKNI